MIYFLRSRKAGATGFIQILNHSMLILWDRQASGWNKREFGEECNIGLDNDKTDEFLMGQSVEARPNRGSHAILTSGNYAFVTRQGRVLSLVGEEWPLILGGGVVPGQEEDCSKK